jgi:hypothetical protein
MSDDTTTAKPDIAVAIDVETMSLESVQTELRAYDPSTAAPGCESTN